MSEKSSQSRPEAAVGAIVFRGREVLLIRRAKPPRQGQWSIPGGRVEWGETLIDAVQREVREETGCIIAGLHLCEALETIHPATDVSPARHLVLIDYAARWVSGEPRAGDDAAEARFVPYAEIETLGLWDETLRVIRKARGMLGD
jgi:8-oxo-dGTP diphosphatase